MISWLVFGALEAMHAAANGLNGKVNLASAELMKYIRAVVNTLVADDGNARTMSDYTVFDGALYTGAMVADWLSVAENRRR